MRIYREEFNSKKRRSLIFRMSIKRRLMNRIFIILIRSIRLRSTAWKSNVFSLKFTMCINRRQIKLSNVTRKGVFSMKKRSKKLRKIFLVSKCHWISWYLLIKSNIMLSNKPQNKWLLRNHLNRKWQFYPPISLFTWWRDLNLKFLTCLIIIIQL